MDEETLRIAAINARIYIGAEGGAGGGLFHKMYGMFLVESASVAGVPELESVGRDYLAIGERWDTVAGMFDGLDIRNPVPGLEAISREAGEIAALESDAVGRLSEITGCSRS
jgi:hypothetical protein